MSSNTFAGFDLDKLFEEEEARRKKEKDDLERALQRQRLEEKLNGRKRKVDPNGGAGEIVPPVVPVVGSSVAPVVLGGVTLGQFNVESVKYDKSEKCHVFLNLLTPVGLFSFVKVYDELLPAQNFEEVRKYNSEAVNDGRPLRFPSFFDYALSAASYIKRNDSKCKAGVEHCLEHVWVHDAKASTYFGTSTDGLYRKGKLAVVEHGVGLPASHDLYHKGEYDIAGANGYINSRASGLQSCIEGLLFENDLGRAEQVLVWRMQPSSGKAYLWRDGKTVDASRVVVFGYDSGNAVIVASVSDNYRPARGGRVGKKISSGNEGAIK